MQIRLSALSVPFEIHVNNLLISHLPLQTSYSSEDDAKKVQLKKYPRRQYTWGKKLPAFHSEGSIAHSAGPLEKQQSG
jgi:hypothetical protein